ncbi:MAG: ATP synthase F1 subunit epsilon [bacterium]
MKFFLIEVITPSKTGYSGMATSITIPGTKGSFQILYNHAPMISTFEIGKVKIVEQGGEEKVFATGGGTVEVLKNKVLLLAESFESPEEIDVQRAKDAYKRAEERIKNRNVEKIDEVRAEAALQRSIIRLKLTGNFTGIND